MCAAVALGNVVGEGQHILVVAVVPPQSGLNDDPIALAPDHDRRIDERRLGAVKVAYESFQPALVEKLLALDLGVTRIGQDDAHARIQEGEFAQAMLDRRKVELDHGEGLGRGREGHFRAAPRPAVDERRRSDDSQLVDGVAMREVDLVLQPLAPDAQLQTRRQSIDDGDADAMQTARDFVGIAVEFSARMQLRHDDFGGGDAFFGVNVDGDAAPIVGDRARTVGVERHAHQFGVAGQRLVDRIVDDFVDHVMEAGAVVGVADIHARALAHRIEPAQDLDRIGVVGFVRAIVRWVRRNRRRLRFVGQKKRLFWVEEGASRGRAAPRFEAPLI
jgi:hypothetical protein